MVLGTKKSAWKALAIRSLVGKSGAIIFFLIFFVLYSHNYMCIKQLEVVPQLSFKNVLSFKKILFSLCFIFGSLY